MHSLELKKEAKLSPAVKALVKEVEYKAFKIQILKALAGGKVIISFRPWASSRNLREVVWQGTIGEIKNDLVELKRPKSSWLNIDRILEVKSI